jgi:hypothetical protein
MCAKIALETALDRVLLCRVHHLFLCLDSYCKVMEPTVVDSLSTLAAHRGGSLLGIVRARTELRPSDASCHGANAKTPLVLFRFVHANAVSPPLAGGASEARREL